MSAAGSPLWLRRRLRAGSVELPYVLWLPPDAGAAGAWPLVVFLHGKGERGRDGWAQTTVGLGPALRRDPERFPCLVVLPQCPDDRRWVEAAELVDAVCAAVQAEQPIDPLRIYLTGISLGGFGTWHHGARCAERWAALLPICGGGDPRDAERLAALPIWAIHGADDPVIPAQASRTMVAAVRACGGSARYSEYAGVGHACWDQAYGDPELIAWLLAQRRA